MDSDPDLFANALERAPAERAAFLAEQCADMAQRARIEALLRGHEKAEGVLGAPLNHRPVDLPAETGATVGRYKLLEKIGEGGCGVVWMAEQTDPVRRLVALKVVKLGMDTKEVIARFESERQALALLRHPNITMILDAGATATGRPYFVMDLVRGLPITRYCDEKQLRTQERLRLFVQVCHALHHAHEKGLVHRDIKPSNIIVTHDGEAPIPKLIDFGIAKATQGRLTDRTLFTAFDQFMGTPAYMSPEQADYNANEIDRRSDVYSLGALLYELTSGRPPFDPKALTSRGLDQARRTIREVEPLRLSTQFQSLPEAEQTALAHRRGLESAEYALHLKGDLDWIAMKALEKNRDRRYATAAALADDVARNLEHKPVHARPPSIGYRAGKFLQRHRPEVWTAIAAVGVTMVVGVAVNGMNRVHPGELPSTGPAKPAPAAAAVQAAPKAMSTDSERLRVRLRENFFAEPWPLVRENEIKHAVEIWLAAYESTPVVERTPQMERDRVLMLARRALATRRQPGQDGDEETDIAVAAGEQLVKTDPSADARLVLACALAVPCESHARGNTTKIRSWFRRSLAIFRSLFDGDESTRARIHCLGLLTSGTVYSATVGPASISAADSLAEARRILSGLKDFAERPDVRLLRGKILGLAAVLRNLSGLVEPEPEAEILVLAESVAREHPQSIDVWRLRRIAYLKHLAVQAREDECLPLLLEADKAASEIVRRDPSSDSDWYDLTRVRVKLARQLFSLGSVNQAVALMGATLQEGGLVVDDTTGLRNPKNYLGAVLLLMAEIEADRGHALAARQALQFFPNFGPFLRVSAGLSPAGERLRRPVAIAAEERKIALLLGEYEAVVRDGEALLRELCSFLVSPATTNSDIATFMPETFQLQDDLARSYVHLSRWAEAEKALVMPAAIKVPRKIDRPITATRWHALAVARLGRGQEALDLISRVQQDARKKLDDGTALVADRRDYAFGLLIEAIARADDPAGRDRRAAALAEAERVIGSLSDEAKGLNQSRTLISWIAEERAKG
jgi:serine/threonine protein kinase